MSVMIPAYPELLTKEFIAYVSSSIDNQKIRLITPDGASDKLLWKIPTQSHPLDGIGTLS